MRRGLGRWIGTGRSCNSDGQPVSEAPQSYYAYLPEVVRRVSVCNQKDSDGRVILDRVDTVGAAGVMFTGVDGK